MNTIIIETARLQMRRMTQEDVPGLSKVFGDAEAMRFYPAPFDRQQVEQWVDWNQRHYTNHGHGLWALILRATGELIGDCGLVHQPVDGGVEIELGYHVRRDLWRQGLATEAALACRDNGFDVLGCRRLISLIHPRNLASRRVAEKIGMTLCREAQWKNKPTCFYAIERTTA